MELERHALALGLLGRHDATQHLLALIGEALGLLGALGELVPQLPLVDRDPEERRDLAADVVVLLVERATARASQDQHPDVAIFRPHREGTDAPQPPLLRSPRCRARTRRASVEIVHPHDVLPEHLEQLVVRLPRGAAR